MLRQCVIVTCTVRSAADAGKAEPQWGHAVAAAFRPQDTLCNTSCWLLYLRLVACLRGEEVGHPSRLFAWYGLP